MQNHQLPHVDSSLLNLKICARIVIQSIPTNQLRPLLFESFWSFLLNWPDLTPFDLGIFLTEIGQFWPLHVESFFKANICPQTESQLPSFLRPTWLNYHPDLSRLQPDYPKIRSRTDQPAQNEGKESFLYKTNRKSGRKLWSICEQLVWTYKNDSYKDCLYLDIIIPTSLYFNEKKGISLNYFSVINSDIHRH